MKKVKQSIFKFLPLIVVIGICSASFFVFKYKNENPKIEWDTSSENIVISVERNYEIDYGYIPAFRVWGDGYIVWTEETDEGRRKVFNGYLSEDELASLLKKFNDSDFFKLCSQGSNYALDYIRINLIEKSCAILIDYSGTLDSDYFRISSLVDLLMKGAGAEKKEFIPIIGYVKVLPIEETSYHNRNITPKYSWQKNKFGFDLENFYEFTSDGKIEGDLLNFIWQVVNDSPFIESNDKIYWIALTIPKITY